jgi:uncharacterized protein YbaR (Trm112 family)
MREYVMAILCSPLSANELQIAEKSNGVFIIRKLDYSERTSDYITSQRFLDSYDDLPFKLMFVFGGNDAIVVRGPIDRQEVQRKLDYVF